MKRVLIVATLLIIFFGGQAIAGKPSPIPNPTVVMETGGGLLTSTDNDSAWHTLFEYPCSTTSPDYIHVSLTTLVSGTDHFEARAIVSFNDGEPTSYVYNGSYIGLGLYTPSVVEFDAAKRQITDTTCAFWKIVTQSNGYPVTVRYNYTVTYPQR